MKKLLFLLLCIISISCSTESSNRTSSEEGNLIGKWQIQSSEQDDNIAVYNNIPCQNKEIEFKSNFEFKTYLYKTPNCNLIVSFDDFILQNNIIIIDNEQILIYQLTSTTLKLKYLNGRIDTYLRL